MNWKKHIYMDDKKCTHGYKYTRNGRFAFSFLLNKVHFIIIN